MRQVALNISCQVFIRGSILVGATLFSLFLNVFFFFILIVSAQNFTDDNGLSSFAHDLIQLLQSECNVAIECLI